MLHKVVVIISIIYYIEMEAMMMRLLDMATKTKRNPFIVGLIYF